MTKILKRWKEMNWFARCMAVVAMPIAIPLLAIAVGGILLYIGVERCIYLLTGKES